MLGLVILCLVVFGCQNALAQVGMGPININLISSSACEGDLGKFSLEVVSINGNQKGFTMDADFDFDMDEKVSYEARVDKIENGQIQEGVFRHGGQNACEDFEKFLGDIWKKMVRAAGMSNDCPKPRGKYHVENFPFENKDVDVKTFLYGRFLLNVNVKRSGETVACRVVEFTNSRPGESV